MTSTAIDLKHDTLESALLKKINNTTISEKTLGKLIKLSCSSTGISLPDATLIFKNKGAVYKTRESSLLSNKINKVTSQITNPTTKRIYEGWLKNCNNTCYHSSSEISYRDFMAQFKHRIGNTLDERDESIVVQDALNKDKVIKIFFEGENPEVIIRQTEAFNKHYGLGSAVQIAGRAIIRNKIGGKPVLAVTSFPTDAGSKLMQLLCSMMNNGMLPAEISENNLLYNCEKNEFQPVEIEWIENAHVDSAELERIMTHIEKCRLMLQ